MSPFCTPSRTAGSAVTVALAAVAVAALVSACVVTSPDADTAPARARATRTGHASPVVDHAPPGLAAAPTPLGPARPLDGVSIVLAPVDASDTEQAEDGSGHVVAPVAPVAIEVTAAEPWPARALDPQLHVGPLQFHRYRYTEPRVLRFVVADRATLPIGADAYVQYGPDELSRVVMARGWVPR